jgi:hypothetical protein
MTTEYPGYSYLIFNNKISFKFEACDGFLGNRIFTIIITLNALN